MYRICYTQHLIHKRFEIQLNFSETNSLGRNDYLLDAEHNNKTLILVDLYTVHTQSRTSLTHSLLRILRQIPKP